MIVNIPGADISDFPGGLQMYCYRPDIIAKTKIPGHGFVHTTFTLKFIPPALFLGVQTMLAPMVYAKGQWNTWTTLWFLVTFLVPATTAILGRWFEGIKIWHAPLAYATLVNFAYQEGVGSGAEIAWLVGMNVWFCVYWAIMGAGLSDPLKRFLEVLDKARGGDLSTRVVLNFPRRDELGRVADGINNLLTTLEQKAAEAAEKTRRERELLAQQAEEEKARIEQERRRNAEEADRERRRREEERRFEEQRIAEEHRRVEAEHRQNEEIRRKVDRSAASGRRGRSPAGSRHAGGRAERTVRRAPGTSLRGHCRPLPAAPWHARRG